MQSVPFISSDKKISRWFPELGYTDAVVTHTKRRK